MAPLFSAPSGSPVEPPLPSPAFAREVRDGFAGRHAAVLLGDQRDRHHQVVHLAVERGFRFAWHLQHDSIATQRRSPVTREDFTLDALEHASVLIFTQS